MSRPDTYIAYQIGRQFPEIYQENGKQLVELVKSYYEFLETQEDNSVYVSRRLFDYKDIDTTLDRFLVFFHKKYLAGFPYDENTMRFAVKHILELYQRKGSEDGLKIFFRLFYQEEITINKPGKFCLRPSASKWVERQYIELEGIPFERVKAIVGKNFRGSVSGAEAIAESVHFVVVNGTYRPVVSLKSARGVFVRGDSLYESRGSTVPAPFYGRVFGSLGASSVSVVASSNGFSVGEPVHMADGQGVNARFFVRKVDANGAVLELKLDRSGFGFAPNTTIELASEWNPGRAVLLSVGTLVGAGKDTGVWESKYAHIGVRHQRVIQDSDYHQDFSYEIQTALLPDKYRQYVLDKMHVAGTKLFTRVCVEEIADVGGDIRLGISRL